MRVTSGLVAVLTAASLSGCTHTMEGAEASYQKGLYDQAAQRWETPALYRNNSEAAYRLGQLHDQGLTSSGKQSELATGWYLRAARAGHVQAMVALARVQMSLGHEEPAISWYQAAAQRGSDEALQFLASHNIPVPEAPIQIAPQQQQASGVDSALGLMIGYAIGCALGGGCSGGVAAPAMRSDVQCTPTQFGNRAPSYTCRPQ